MVEGDSIKNKSDSYNVEAGIQPNYNSSRNNSIDNRSILQPYSLGSGGKDPEYQFAAVNKGYETDISSAGGDKHDVEKGSAAVIEVTNGVAIHGGNGGGGNNGGGSGADGRRSTGIRAGFEQAIELCGYGKFHYILLAICGLVSTSEEMDVISMSFILPSAECDLDLNTSSKGWLNSIIFIGMMVGAYFWGSIADAVGRKKVLIVISFMNGFCIVASSFSQTYEWFMLFRFLNGAAQNDGNPILKVPQNE